MSSAAPNRPVRRQIIWLIATLGAGLVLMAALYLAASAVIGQIDRRMYEYHDHAQTLALRLHNNLSAALIPRGSAMGRDGVSVDDWRAFAGEAIRSYDEILALEGEITALHREFENRAVPDRAMTRLARAIAELRSLRERHRSDRAGFAVAFATSRPYLDVVAQQLSRHHAAALMSLQEHRRRVMALCDVIGVVLFLCILAGVAVLMRRNLRAVDALLEDDARQREALRTSEERYRLLFDGAPIAIFLQESGIFRYANEAAVKLFGVENVTDLVGHDYLDYVHPEERAAAAARVRNFSEGRPDTAATVRRIVRPGGDIRFVSTIGAGFREGDRTLVQEIAQDITDQIRDEALRRESEAKFAAAFQGSTDPMCILRTRDGLIQEVNDAYIKQVGYSREEMIGRTTVELGLSTDPLLRDSMIETLRTEGSVSDLPWKLRTKTGELRDILHSAYRIEGAGEPRHVAIIRDVTEQKRRERELRESEAKFSAAFYGSPDAMVINRTRDGMILDINPAYERFFGYQRQEAIGRTPFELGVLANPRARPAFIERLLREGKLEEMPWLSRIRSGEVREVVQSAYLVDIGGEPHHVAILRDMTERNRAVTALRQSEERLTQAIRVADIGIFDHDQRDDSIYWSPRQRSIYGWDADEPVTLAKFIDTIFPEDRDKVGAAVGRAHDPRGDGRFDVENRVVRRDGELRWLSTRGQTFFEGKGPARWPVRSVGAVVDVTERKRVDEAISRSEALLAEAQRTAHLGSFERNFVTNESVWSDETYRLLGCEPGSLEPRFDSVLKFVHPDDRENFIAAYEYSLKPESGGKYECEHRIVGHDGVERFLYHRATVTFDGRGKPVRIFGTSQDVTETRRAEQALRESEQRFQTLIESVPDPIFVHVDGHYVYANPAALELLGAKRVDDIVGRDALTIVHPDSRELVRRRISMHQSGEAAPRNVDQRWVRADGTPIDVLVTGVPFDLAGKRAVHVIARDITERKRAEQALRESERKFAELFRFAPVAMSFAYKSSGPMLADVNVAWVKQFGVKREDAMGKDGVELGLWDLASREKVASHLQTYGAVKRMEFPYASRDGTAWTGLLSAMQVPVEEDTMIIFVTEDITERRQLEAELHDLNRELESRIAERTAQLQESNKELESFSYSVSHDLRAPLRHIVGYVDLLRQSSASGPNEESRRRMDIIASAAKRMGNLIDDLLSFSRVGRQGMKVSTVDANALLRDVLEELRPETQEREIVWACADLPELVADRGLLKLVFTNLLSNAIKFTRGRSPARIEVGCHAGPGNADEWVIFVRDNGAGFEMDYYDKLFGVFQRLHSDREFEGTGIGLANCRRIIDRHGGRIWAEGAVGAGATFYFTLPRMQDRGRA
jgi:PAS domain S-box-containing protein